MNTRNQQEKRKVFGVRLNTAELEALRQLAEREERTKGEVLRRLLRKAARAQTGQ